MPVLTVKGMPSDVKMGGLLCSLQSSAGCILRIPGNDVSVFFPADLVQEGLGEELVCVVDGLFEKPERTPELREIMASAIKSTLVAFATEHLSQCCKVEVIVNRFNQDVDGFAVWERPKN